jgi:hypothetical protein
VPVSRMSDPCRFLCSLGVAIPTKRTNYAGKATHGWSRVGPATRQNRSKWSSAGPELVQTGRRTTPPSRRERHEVGGDVEANLGKSACKCQLCGVWCKFGPKLPTHHW